MWTTWHQEGAKEMQKAFLSIRIQTGDSVSVCCSFLTVQTFSPWSEGTLGLCQVQLSPILSFNSSFQSRSGSVLPVHREGIICDLEELTDSRSDRSWALRVEV